MWQPEPGWERLAGGLGPSSLGVWRVPAGSTSGDLAAVVKRLHVPGADDPDEMLIPTHSAWWRREADVAESGVVTATHGLRSPAVLDVLEDADGVSIWYEEVAPSAITGLQVARCQAEFAGLDLGEHRWLCRDLLASRLTRTASRGGWPTLARTPVADVADRFWDRRQHHLNALAALPQVSQHGDPVPSNLHAPDGETIIALDWSTLGVGPVGADLGFYALAAREELEPLVAVYHRTLPEPLRTQTDVQQISTAARVVALYTAFTRAEWALARVADGEGALASKFRHPSVAPHLRTLQRVLPWVEGLL